MAISAAPADAEEFPVAAPPVDVVPLVPAPAEPPATELKSAVPLRAPGPVVVEVPVAEAPVADVPEVPEVEAPVAEAPVVEAPGTPAPEAAPAKAARRTARKTTAPLDGELPFVPWVPKTAGDRKVLDALSDARVARTVKRVLTAGLKAEGPVHRDRLTRLAASAFGLTRVSEARRDALLALLPPATLAGDFVWPEALDRDSWSSFRRQAASADRPLEHVAPEEVGNAMVALCRASAGMTQDELFLRTAEVFGYRRRTPSLLPLLEAALARVLDAGRLTRQESGLLTAAA
jgi:hypothetical protein